MILLCPVTCWAQRKIIIMIRKKQPNSILFLQWAICLPSDLSLAQHLQKGDHLGGGGETLATSKAIRTGWPWEVLGPLQASGGGIAHGLRICGVWNAHSCLWVRFQLSLHQFVEAWPLLNLLQGPQSHYDGWSNPYLAYNPGRTPHHLQGSPFPWHPLPLATLTLPLSFNTCIPLHSCYAPVTLNSLPFPTCAFFPTHMPHTAPGQLLGWAPTPSKSQLKHLLMKTLSEFSSRMGFHSLVPKSYFYIPHHEREGMKWPGAEERLLRLRQMVQMVWEDVVKGSCGLELGPACRGLDIFKVSMVLPISS